MVNDLWINAGAGVLAFVITSLLTFFWKKYHEGRPKFLSSNTQLYPLPEKGTSGNNYYAVVAIWNPSSVSIRSEDLTEPVKIYAPGASAKILSVTDGRMNKPLHQQGDYFHLGLDEIPSKAGLVVALNPCNRFIGVDGQVNNKPIFKHDGRFLPENLHIFYMFDGAVMALAYILTLFSGVIVPEEIGALRYFLPLILFTVLFRYPFKGFTSWTLKRIDMPYTLQESFGGRK